MKPGERNKQLFTIESLEDEDINNLDQIIEFGPNHQATSEQQSRIAVFASWLYKRITDFMSRDKQTASVIGTVDFTDNGKTIEKSVAIINDPKANESNKENAMTRIHKALGDTYNIFTKAAKATGEVSMDLVDLARAESNNAGHELAKLCRLAYRNCEDYIAKKRGYSVDQNAREAADTAHNKGATDFNAKGEKGRAHLGAFAGRIGTVATSIKNKAEKIIADRKAAQADQTMKK